MARELDTSPLTAPVTRDEVAQWKVAARRAGIGELEVGTVVTLVIAGFIGVAVLLVVGGIAATAISALSRGGSGGLALLPLPILVVAIIAAVVWARTHGLGGRWERWMRLDRFAQANRLRFSTIDRAPQYPGAIFGVGNERASVEHLTSADGRFLDLGNYRYTTGSGDEKKTHRWGFLAFNLDRRLPHMLLDSTANNGLFGGTNLPASFDREQVLGLEGDFDRYFTLYCPREYERDALYVFTPDLMALMIDEASPFDVEIVDDWMFVYSSTPFEMLSPELHRRLFRIVDTVGAKALRQTARYADDRVGDVAANIVATPGQRLRRRTPATIIVFVVIGGFWIAGQFVDGGVFGIVRSLFGG